MKKRYVAIDYLKGLACLLVINVHADILMPESLSILAFGGDLANNLFFTISGFTLYTSITSSDSRFGTWYLKRILRIIPMTYFATILLLVFDKGKVSSLSSFLWTFLFPGAFWFASAIIFLYIFLYLYGRSLKIWQRILYFFAIVILLFYPTSLISAERHVIGLLAMTAGFELKKCIINGKILKRTEYKYLLPIAIPIFAFLFVIFKLYSRKNVGDGMMSYWYIPVGLVSIMLSICLIMEGIMMDERLSLFAQRHTTWQRVVTLVSKCTFPAYLIGIWGDRCLTYHISKNVIWPYGYLVNMTSIIFLAYILDAFFSRFYIDNKAER